MKCLILGAGRIDVHSDGTHDVMDPFLHLCDALGAEGHDVRVEINAPFGSPDPAKVAAAFPNLEVALSSRYSGFLNYFTRLENFGPCAIHKLWKEIAKAEVVILRVPGPMVFQGHLLARLLRRKTILFVASDLHQIRDNALAQASRTIRRKGHCIALLCWILQRGPARFARLRLYLSEAIRARFAQTPTKNDLLFTSSILETVYTEDLPKNPQAPVRLVFIGRLVAEKGLTTLVEVFTDLKKRNIPVTLEIMGDGRDGCQLRNDLAQFEEFVTFHGWVSDRKAIEAALRRADFCLLPSHNEGTPKIIFEAMATRTIFVGTRVGGIPSVITHRTNGLLFDPLDAHQAAAEIAACLEKPSLQRQILDAGTAQAKHHTLQATAGRLAQHLQEVCDIKSNHSA